jgi:hypothetical protein
MADAQKAATTNFNAPDEKSAREALAAPAAAVKPVITRPEHCCVSTYWAVIERDGTLIRGRNVIRSKRLATGQYEVVFTGDVSGGVYQATIGRPGIATEPAGEIGVALRCCLSGTETNHGVWVDTHDSGGASSDRAFHVMAFTD